MTEPGYRPYGWEEWPDFPWWSYQFRRVLGETQEGGGAISECFMAADAMRPGDGESWFGEWRRLADRSAGQAAAAEAAAHVVTARNACLRATNYCRASEYGLAPSDPRRLAVSGSTLGEDLVFDWLSDVFAAKPVASQQ